MSVDDEIRYGRTCSLVLNKSVTVLRRVVEHSYTTQGAPSFEVFLNNNRHALFHLLFKHCCCGNNSTVTPLSRYQWQILYVRTSTRNPHGWRGECPCQYAAISGVTPDVMDVSLCCLVLRNVCSGVSMPDVDMIRDVRNKLIHASNASLDATLFLATWSKVEAAMLNLAQCVSSSLRSDTICAVQALKNRLMDSSELSEMKALVMDEKRISEIERTQDITQDELEQHKIHTVERFRHVTNELESIREDQEVLMSGTSQQKDFPEGKIDELKKTLLESYQKATEKIQVSPLQKKVKKLPLDMIFAPVVIRQDLEDKTTESDQNDSKPNVKTQLVRNPKDVFYKDGKPVRHIFMQGEAAHGKTVYCKRLLQYWCASKQVETQKKGLSEWEKSLDEFDFVFFFMFRLVNKTTTSIVDMILDEVSQHSPECADAIRHVLSNKKYRCLIIMDGLDEWKISQNQRQNLRYKRFPNFGNLSASCSLYITFRPWLYDVIVDLAEDADRVVDICGIDEDGINLVIENMLINFYKMDATSVEYKETRMKMIEKSKNKNLKSIMEIPLLITASVMLWFEKEHVGGGFTSFYISLVQLLIKRALDTDAMDEDLVGRVEKKSISGLQIPSILQKVRNKTVRRFIGVLNTLGKLAYDDLLSDETSLVFGKEELEDKIDEDDKEFALRAGLLSQCEAPGCFDEENVSVNFFHKTVQEFLAAIHVLCNKSVVFNELCSHIRSIDILFDLSNVVVFLSGLSPSVGDELSQYVANLSIYIDILEHYPCILTLDLCKSIINSISGNRINMSLSDFLANSETLHSIRLFDFNNDTLSNFGRHLPLKHLCLSNVSLSEDTCCGIIDSVKSSLLLKKLELFNARRSIGTDSASGMSVYARLQSFRSFNLKKRKINTSGMSDNAWLQDLLHVLPDCMNLTTISIDYYTIQNEENCVVLMAVLPKLKNLHEFSYHGLWGLTQRDSLGCNLIFANSLKNSSQLRKLNVASVNLRDFQPQSQGVIRSFASPSNKFPGKDMKTLYGQDEQTLSPDEIIVVDPRLNYDQQSICFLDSNDISIELTSAWTNLEKLELFQVFMSPWGWYKFLISLLEIRHSFDVALIDTDIDKESINMVHSCPYFSMKKVYRARPSYRVHGHVHSGNSLVNLPIKRSIWQLIFATVTNSTVMCLLE